MLTMVSPLLPAKFDKSPGPVPSVRRIVFIIVLAVGTAAIMGAFRPPHARSSRDWLTSPEQVTLPADIMYRLGVGLQARGSPLLNSGLLDPQVLQQAAIALYERNALGPHPSVQTTYRLGIIYSKSGYPEHGRRFLERAAELDEENYQLYLLLSQIYADEPPDEKGLLRHVALLDQQERWLAGLTKADLYERIGQTERSTQLRQDWVHRQVILTGIAGTMFLVYALLGLGGLIILTAAAIRWGVSQRPRRYPAGAHVPWGMIDVAEALVVLLFLMTTLAVGGSAVRQYLGEQGASETLEALLVGVVYLLSVGGTVALIIYRVGVGQPFWRLLGGRGQSVLVQIGQGIAGYAVVIGALGAGMLLLRLMGLGGAVPLGLLAAKAPTELLTQARHPATFAVYFLLVCLIAPVMEEIIFRGFVYRGLRRIIPVGPAALFSGLLFASVHLSAPAGGLVVIGLIGVVLAYLYERTGSLLPAMVTHSLYNTFVFVLLASYALV